MKTVLKVSPLNDYKLLLLFDTDEKRIYDVKPLLEKPVFKALADTRVYNNVYIEYGAVTWKDENGNEIDICPDKMYKDSKPLS